MGDKNEVTNYRPICIQSTITKLFEKLILDKIIGSSKFSIFPEQHDFILYQYFISIGMAKKL